MNHLKRFMPYHFLNPTLHHHNGIRISHLDFIPVNSPAISGAWVKGGLVMVTGDEGWLVVGYWGGLVFGGGLKKVVLSILNWFGLLSAYRFLKLAR
jgi:hypothetical protein